MAVGLLTGFLRSAAHLHWLTAGLVMVVLCASAAGQTRNDVDVDLEQFGVGSIYRQGEVTGIRVRLTGNPASPLEEATPLWVQWEVPNADGDIVEYGRSVTLTRGRPSSLWLYAPLPNAVSPDTTFAVRVFEMRDGRRRMELGGRRFRPGDAISTPDMVGYNVGMMAVIGQRQLGLRSYGMIYEQMERPYAAHELTRLAFGIRPDQLPDRWEGLKGFEAIAWSDASPQQLTSDTARALREYVRRGGHLIITLPEDVNPWQFAMRGQTLLDDMLPQTEPRKDEGVHITELLPVMSKARGTVADFTVGIRVFRDDRRSFSAIDHHYEPLIALPDGRVVVVQRLYGFGRVTISGIDLSSQRLYTVPLSNGSVGLPQADVWWNRILGRRADMPTTSELDRIRQDELLMRSSAMLQALGSGGLIAQQVAMSTQAGFGLLLALVLFGVYWLLAGPAGFGLLKMYKQVKHAWVAFALAAGVFTAVAWGVVGVIRIKEPQIRHLTVLDHIARPGESAREEDPQFQRAVSWMELYIPGYGRPQISLDSDANQRNLLLPWAPPGETLQRFPNTDRYAIDVGTGPNRYEIPSRSTSTQLYANWLGGLDPNWGGMIRSHPDDPIRVIGQGSTRKTLTGAIVHDLPDNLRDVSIIWVRSTRHSPLRYARSGDQEMPFVPKITSGQMPNIGYFFSLQGAWNRGDVIDLRSLEANPQALLNRNMHDRYVAEHMTSLGTPRPSTADSRRKFLEMLSFFHQLTPPEYLKQRREDQEPTNRVIFNRHIGRELDLSVWMTRPCIIVIGYLDNSELPIHLRINDRDDASTTSTGTTMVRWIYPLPLDEEAAFAHRQEEPPLAP
jgi:hypothetical protein